jgi:hypothetical protein
MKVHELFEEEERSILSVMGKQPMHFNGHFSCSNKKLTSLKGAPSSVSGYFSCYSNNLTSLEGAPSSVGGHFVCSRNKLTSLHNIHKQIKHIGLNANFEFNPITSCVLGLLLIDGLKEVYLDNTHLQSIINKHIKGDKDIFACQEELIENGFDEFAKL